MSLPPYLASQPLSRESHREERRRRARRVSRILRAVAVVVMFGVAGLLAHGANRPPDPYLVDEVADGRRPLEGFDEVVFRITSGDGTAADWCALLADDDATRSQGLMEQTDLRGYDGMVFRFDQPTATGFWMRNTRIPLSIAFYDAEGSFVDSGDMEPCPDDVDDCPTFGPDEPYTEAIEVAQGDLAQLGIGPGSTLSFPGGTCAPGSEPA